MSVLQEGMQFGVGQGDGRSTQLPKPTWNSVQGVKQQNLLHPANPAQVMRAAQKDSSITSFVQQEVTELLREILRNVPKRENVIHILKHLSQLIYYGCTSLSGFQTLGEEYSGIIMISGSSIPSKLLLLEMVLLKCCGGLVITSLIRKGFFHSLLGDLKTQERKSEKKDIDRLVGDIISCLPTLNTGIFYLTGDFYDISKRLTGIRYVLVHIWLRWKNTHSGFMVLGVVSLLYSFTRIVQAIIKYNHQVSLEGSSHTLQPISIPDDESRCSFCFEVRKSPAVTPCGHLFCWKCIMHALQVDNKCPLCRESVDSSRVVILKNYQEINR